MKSNLVLSGTMRRRRTGLLESNGDGLRTEPPEPGSDHDAGERESSKYSRDDPDAERQRETAHRTRSDEEQHRGGDKGRDVGIENRRERARESSVEGADRGAS